MSAEVVVLLVALGLEVVVGDPVSRWHPVALFGQAAAAGVRCAPRRGPGRQLIAGGVIVVVGVGGVALGSTLLLAAVNSWSAPASVVVGAVLLKTSFSYRQLVGEALGVARHLDEDQVSEAARSLRALVSRETAGLPAGLVVSAAVESLAENLADSFVAPLLFFMLFGVPGALAYRALNTLDAMIGYRGEFEYLGKVAARADDVANLVPARLTSMLLVLGALGARGDWRAALRIALRDHAQTESPNAGWPMAAMAGALGVELEKADHYRIGDARVERTPATIRQAVQVLCWASALAVLGTAIGVVG